MAQFLGMNPEEVRALANDLNAKAGEIEQIKSQLSSKLESTNWVGQDANQFRSEWNSTHVPAINRVVEALRQASQTATKNAAQQDQTSAAL